MFRVIIALLTIATLTCCTKEDKLSSPERAEDFSENFSENLEVSSSEVIRDTFFVSEKLLKKYLKFTGKDKNVESITPILQGG